MRIERDDLSLFAPGVTFATDRGDLTVSRARRHHGNLILAFEGVDDRDAAEALRGTQLTAERAAVRLDDDEWWSGDLVGCRVVDTTGAAVGTVAAVEEGVAHARLLISMGGETVEVPFVDAFVPEVDPGEGTVVIDLPDGWWTDQ